MNPILTELTINILIDSPVNIWLDRLEGGKPADPKGIDVPRLLP
jgi:hypothetical protein